MAKKKYDWKKTVWKGLKFLVFVAVPASLDYLLVQWNPAWTGVTVGALLEMLSNWLKHRKS